MFLVTFLALLGATQWCNVGGTAEAVAKFLGCKNSLLHFNWSWGWGMLKPHLPRRAPAFFSGAGHYCHCQFRGSNTCLAPGAGNACNLCHFLGFHKLLYNSRTISCNPRWQCFGQPGRRGHHERRAPWLQEVWKPLHYGCSDSILNIFWKLDIWI